MRNFCEFLEQIVKKFIKKKSEKEFEMELEMSIDKYSKKRIRVVVVVLMYKFSMCAMA